MATEGCLHGGKTPGHQQEWRRGLPFPGLPWSQSWAHCGPAGKRSCDSGHLVPPQPVEATDDAFWDQFWADTATSVQDVFALVPAAEIRAVREESPSNLATLCYKVRGAQPLAVTAPRAISHDPREAGAGPALWCNRAGTQDIPTQSRWPQGFTHFSPQERGSGGWALAASQLI